MSTRVQFRRGTAEEWADADTILGDGEPGYEKGTGRFKIGDGATPWSALPFDGAEHFIGIAEKGVANGVAVLDNGGKLPSTYLGPDIARTADIPEAGVSETDMNTAIAAATTDFLTEPEVDTKIANVVASSPEALNTLNELATALGNDPNFATTITTLIGTKLAAAEKGAANGVASLDSGGKVPSAQLPTLSALLDMDVTLGGVATNLPIYVAKSNPVVVSGGATMNVVAPAGILAGDLILMFAWSNEVGAGFTAGMLGAGFTLLRNTPELDTLAVGYKFATGSESGVTHPVTWKDADHYGGAFMVVYRYAGTPIFKAETVGTNVMGAATGVTTGQIVLGVRGGGGASPTAVAPFAIRQVLWDANGQGLVVIEHTAPSDGTFTPAIVGENSGQTQTIVIPTAEPGSYTLDSTDAGKVVEMAGTGSITLTVPTDAAEDIPVGSVILLRKTGATGTITIQGQDGSVGINPAGATLDEQWQTVLLHKRSANQWAVAEWVTPTQLAALQASLTAITHNTQTGAAYTPVLADAGKMIEMDNAGANTVTIPLNATTAYPIGTVLSFRQVGVGQTTIAIAGGGALEQRESKFKIAGRWGEASAIKRATDQWVLQGDLTT